MRRRLLATGRGPLKTFHECRSEEPSRSGAFTVCSFLRCFVTDVRAVGPEMQQTRQNATIFYQFEFPATNWRVLNRDTKNSSKCNYNYQFEFSANHWCSRDATKSSKRNDFLPIWISRHSLTGFEQRYKKLNAFWPEMQKTRQNATNFNFSQRGRLFNLALLFRFENFNPSKPLTLSWKWLKKASRL